MIENIGLSANASQASAESGWLDGIAKLVEVASDSQLALAAFLSIAVAGICYYFFKDAPVWARLISFIATLLFAFGLSIKLIVPPAAATSIDHLNLAKILIPFPKEQRMEKCLLIESEEACQRIVESVVDFAVANAPPETLKAVTSALKDRKVTEAVVDKAVRATPAAEGKLVSLGVSNGWNIDVFWCEAKSAEARKALAARVAARLGEAKSFGGGFSAARVRLRSLSSEKQANPGYPSSGYQVRGEAGESAAMQALVTTLNNEAADTQFEARTVSFHTPNYLSVFVCS